MDNAQWNFKSGLLYFGYRFYVPHMERWLNRDPIGTNGGLNIYAYVEQNPIMYVDPKGLYLCDLLSHINGNIDLGVSGGKGIAGGVKVSVSSDGVVVAVTTGVGGGGAVTATTGGNATLGEGGDSIGGTGIHISTSTTISGGKGKFGGSVSINAGSNGVYGSSSVGYGIGKAIVSGVTVSGTVLDCIKEKPCK